ncbi:trehalose operon repressor [Listeria sp. FSL L7-1485]|uniref:Trehalose operon repressor n=3 Tax=Listeria immobilis TaxID=2713502 RepID=A0A7X0X6P0_9LIST|nr:trehalose operon repressor [Listeria immobilis]MBC1484565.1 trehalose operon repressor [Listeria immobilis]MBC1488564.1 trehalose operon repressor [Listeria immobilis]MBC1506149.1 trehalose operon repressor [Listeria immobilis]MBC1515297.1 trehalose operon repressor [Listeria immobilis]MBC1536994.1 trehalose operon repressor [Listeria immobilis]
MNKKNKFFDIYLELEQDITSGVYPAGTLLPSENVLAKRFSVSRETIRKALVLLLENGCIQKLQGKGSVVLDRERYSFPVSGLTSFKELQKSEHMNATTKVIKNKQTTLPSQIADFAGLPKDTKCLEILRVRYLEEEATILDYDYLLGGETEPIATNILEDSLYQYLENEKGYEISYAQKEITVEPLNANDKKYLALHGDTHVVVVKSTVFLKDTTLFQYTESRHRMDKFRFIDFARRR